MALILLALPAISHSILSCLRLPLIDQVRLVSKIESTDLQSRIPGLRSCVTWSRGRSILLIAPVEIGRLALSPLSRGQIHHLMSIVVDLLFLLESIHGNLCSIIGPPFICDAGDASSSSSGVGVPLQAVGGLSLKWICI